MYVCECGCLATFTQLESSDNERSARFLQPRATGYLLLRPNRRDDVQRHWAVVTQTDLYFFSDATAAAPVIQMPLAGLVARSTLPCTWEAARAHRTFTRFTQPQPQVSPPSDLLDTWWTEHDPVVAVAGASVHADVTSLTGWPADVVESGDVSDIDCFFQLLPPTDTPTPDLQMLFHSDRVLHMQAESIVDKLRWIAAINSRGAK